MMATLPKVVGRVRDLRAAVAGFRAEGSKVALVPTMGALHVGHMALAEKARELAGRTVVSIFVNPAQFAPHEDFDKYPRALEADLNRLADVGVDLVYAPTATEMYPAGFATRIAVGGPSEGLETDFRPHFFGGVATVVGKLFIQCAPDYAMFGEKDYQQLKIIERLVLDLDLGVGIVACPTVREADGLALSSRNTYLSREERAAAIAVPEALEAAAAALAWGERDVAALEEAMRDAFETRTAGSAVSATLDYAAVVDPATLEPLEVVTRSARALVAAHVGRTHLIDNCALVPPVA